MTDEHVPTPTSPPAGVRLYADRVGRYLVDRPAAERAATVSDLASHLAERGLTSFEQCETELGDAKAYAADLREELGLGLVPGWFRRNRWNVAVGSAAIIGLGAWAATAASHDELDPNTFRPLTFPISYSSGERVDSVGSVARVKVGDVESVATIGYVVRNTSDRDLEIEFLGVPQTTRKIDGTGGFGYSVAPPKGERAGQVGVMDVWQAKVATWPVDSAETSYASRDVTTGTPFAPFTLRAGEQVMVAVYGTVGTCTPELAGFDQQLGGPLAINFTVGDNLFSMGGPEMVLDTSDCG